MKSTSEWRKDELFQEKVNATVEKVMIRRYNPLWISEEMYKPELFEELDQVHEFAVQLHRFLDKKAKEK